MWEETGACSENQCEHEEKDVNYTVRFSTSSEMSAINTEPLWNMCCSAMNSSGNVKHFCNGTQCLSHNKVNLSIFQQ